MQSNISYLFLFLRVAMTSKSLPMICVLLINIYHIVMCQQSHLQNASQSILPTKNELYEIF